MKPEPPSSPFVCRKTKAATGSVGWLHFTHILNCAPLVNAGAFIIDIAPQKLDIAEMRARQLSLPSFEFKKKLSFGGLTQGKGNPKGARHVATQRAMHLILKSTKAQGEYSFLLKAREIESLIDEQARAQGIKVYEGANAGNHIHLIVKTPSRKALARFLRAIAGLIARKMLKAERGSPNKLQKFFDARPFTRILNWGRDYNQMKRYLMINRLELTGMTRAAIRHMLAKVDELQRSGVLAQSLSFDFTAQL